MSILYCDGFEQFAAFDDLQKFYTQGGASMSLIADTVFGRGKALRQDTGTACGIRKTIPQQAPNAVMGMAVRVRLTSYPSSGDRKVLMGFYENTTQHMRLYLQPDGTLAIYAGHDWRQNTIESLQLNRWYHLEVKYSCDDVNGYFELRVDGKTVMLYNGDTRYFSDGLIDTAAIADNSSTAESGTADFDDWVVWDASGTEYNDWIGDVEVQTSMPTADDVVTGWTPNVGDAWDAINDDGEDGDDTYIACSTTGNPASFAVADLATSPSKILAVQAFVVARKDDSGNRSIRFGVDSNGAPAESPDTPLGTGYTAFTQVFQKNPDGDVPWDTAAVNALKARVQVTV